MPDDAERHLATGWACMACKRSGVRIPEAPPGQRPVETGSGSSGSKTGSKTRATHASYPRKHWLPCCRCPAPTRSSISPTSASTSAARPARPTAVSCWRTSAPQPPTPVRFPATVPGVMSSAQAAAVVLANIGRGGAAGRERPTSCLARTMSRSRGSAGSGSGRQLAGRWRLLIRILFIRDSLVRGGGRCPGRPLCAPGADGRLRLVLACDRSCPADIRHLADLAIRE